MSWCIVARARGAGSTKQGLHDPLVYLMNFKSDPRHQVLQLFCQIPDRSMSNGFPVALHSLFLRPYSRYDNFPDRNSVCNPSTSVCNKGGCTEGPTPNAERRTAYPLTWQIRPHLRAQCRSSLVRRDPATRGIYFRTTNQGVSHILSHGRYASAVGGPNEAPVDMSMQQGRI